MLEMVRNTKLLNIYIITLISMMVAFGSQSIGVLYVLELGGGVFEVNLIGLISSIIGLILLVPFGIITDRFGRRPMLLYSGIIALLGITIRAFATEPSHLLFAALVNGLSGIWGGFPIFLSMVNDLAKPKEQKKAINTFYFFSSIGMLTGPFICSLLLTLPQISLRNIYQIFILIKLGELIYLATQIKETKHKIIRSEKIEYRTSVSRLLHQTNFKSIISTAFLFFFFYSIMNTYIPIYARIELNFSNAQVASFATFRNLATMLIRFASATFLTRVPVRPLLLSTLILGGVTSIASSFANNYLSIALVIALSGLSYGIVMSSGSTLVAKYSTTENRAVANSIYMSTSGLGNIIKILTTPIVDTLGLNSVFIIGSISVFTAIIPLLMRREK